MNMSVTQINLTPSDPIGIRRMPKNAGISGFLQDTGLFRHPTTSGRNPIPRIPTTSEKFLSDPIVGLLVLGMRK